MYSIKVSEKGAQRGKELSEMNCERKIYFETKERIYVEHFEQRERGKVRVITLTWTIQPSHLETAVRLSACQWRSEVLVMKAAAPAHLSATLTSMAGCNLASGKLPTKYDE